ncbi:MAG: acyltransferase family protein [Flavobacteriaceae bacterium]|nr:acyltransferase family protein [Bacteroidia bacterium]MBT8286616.1 acyltransferase family protein [Bacteroidia bacterium]NNF75141.1 acyltransferase family protein [Flavobacteriaceae bacterium]NNK72157.1 acyltransferase family protein [Flavobacteriaceae bacterium]
MSKVRRYDIDWIRVLVFDVLIIYHVGMFFVPWGWHIKNDIEVEWMRYPMVFVNQWRLPILFVVSGMGTCYAMSFRTGKVYIKERFKRLFIPLLTGILIMIPPQVYIERLVYGDTDLSFFNWFPEFFKGIYPTGNFSWHHLWFLPYLLLMSLLATPLFLKWRRPENVFISKIRKTLNKSPFYLYLFTIPFFFIEAFLEPIFPVNHALVGDWYALTAYGLLFLCGFVLIAVGETFWENVNKIKVVALFIGVISFPSLFWFWINKDPSVFIPILKVVNVWSWMLVIFGYSAKYLNKESRIIKYRNKAVYPFYILHQTITIIIGFYLMSMPIHYGLKFVVMLVGTFGFSWLIYEFIIRRWQILWPLFGLKKPSKQNNKQKY